MSLLFLANCLIINLLAQTKSPNEFLPHPLGSHFTPHFQLVQYFEEVARTAPTTLKLTKIGVTNEDRPQIIAVISSPQNMARLEEIRLQHLRETGLEKSKNDPNLTQISVVWLSYSVHGNEPAGSEAAMQVLFDLATQTRPDIKEWLKNTVVILDPSQNPDGYDRYTHWFRMAANRVAQPNPRSREHLEPWPGGRPNHYYFDLNRDWAWLTQVESRARIEAYHAWLPHIHADIHEQGFDNPYYFAPAAEPFHEIITDFQRNFQTEIGQNHAKYFDKNGWLYFAKEEFDLLYPSYGDTYPTYNGAIGMTYEQAGIRAGRAIFTEIGDTLLLQDRVAHHYATSISTIETASKNATRLTENFKKYFADATNSPRGQWKSFVIKAKTGDDFKIDQLTKLLEKHHISFGFAGQTGSFKAFSYQNGREETFSLQQNDLVVSCFQAHSDMAIALLEPETKLTDSVTYDITAWSLPFAFGLDAFALKTKLEPKNPYVFRGFSPILPSGRAAGYLVRWQDSRGPRFLSEILKNGLRARYLTAEMETEGQVFPTGSLLVTRGDNQDFGDKLDEIVAKAAKIAEIDAFPAKSGFVTRGQDFGSNGQKFIAPPEVGIVYSDDCDENSFGHIWWHFEQELAYPVAAIPLKSVEKGNLEGLTTLIFPEGISVEDASNLKTWIQKGGRVVAIGDAVKNFADKSDFDLKKKTAIEPKDTNAEPKPLYLKGRAAMSDAVFGAIVQNRVDASNPLGFGLGAQYFSLKTSDDSYDFLKNSSAVWVSEKYKSYGFIGANVRPKIKNSLTAGAQSVGKGSIIYLIDPPLFRGFWQEGKLLFDNAVFF